MTSSAASPRSIIATYVLTTALFTLSTSVIWGVNTLFLLAAGLDIFEVFLVSAAFSAGDLLFQVPTGVIADAFGRKVAFLLSLVTLIVSTLAYVGAYAYGLGVGAFALSSVFLGLGFTFYSGAMEAWVVDGLDAVGYEGTREQVFSWGTMAFSAAMVAGTLAGGFLGEVDLALPYLVRSALLAATLVLAAALMREDRPAGARLTAGAFRERTAVIARTGLGYIRGSAVVRPLLFASVLQGSFLMYGFYSWQRFFLDVLGRDIVWVNGVVAALFGLSGVAGAISVRRVTAGGTRDAAPILARLAWLQALPVAAVGALGVLLPVSARGFWPFAVLVALYVVYGLLVGMFRPIRQAYINPHIRSDERATVLSLDWLFNDAGGIAGQAGLGYLSQAVSIPAAWLVSGVLLATQAPFYRRSGAAASRPSGGA